MKKHEKLVEVYTHQYFYKTACYDEWVSLCAKKRVLSTTKKVVL